MSWLAVAALSLAQPSFTEPVDVGLQLVAALGADDSTRGGGGGAGIELGVPVARSPWPELGWLLRARASVLTGIGLAYTLDLGVALRLERQDRWQPDVGLYVTYWGGALVRSVDERGRLAPNPLGLQAGISALRFQLSDGWISLLSCRAGPPLGRSGAPPLLLSVAILEVGQTF